VTIRLEPLAKTDIDGVMSWVNDPRVMGYFRDRQEPISREDELAMLEKLIASGYDHVYSIFHDTVIDNMIGEPYTDSKYVGQCALHLDKTLRSARLFIAICHDHQRKGYGSGAIQQLLAYAFDVLRLPSVELTVRSENRHAQTMYVKLGFNFVENQLKSYKLGDRVLDMVLMSARDPKRAA